MALLRLALTITIVVQISISTCAGSGVLYPKSTESRQAVRLDGTWNLRVANVLNPDEGFNDRWYSVPLHENASVFHVPVPSNYADVLGQDVVDRNLSVGDRGIMEFRPGWVWYEREFSVPELWKENRRIFLRIGAAHYNAIVYVNGKQSTEHEGGSLPFVVELPPGLLNFGTREDMSLNRVTIAVNGTLTQETIPQGLWRDDGMCRTGRVNKCYGAPGTFYRFAGIHGSVFLYTTPMTFIDDVSIVTDYNSTSHTGYVKYSIQARKGKGMCRNTADTDLEGKPECSFTVELKDSYVNQFTGEQLEYTVASSEESSGELVVEPQNLRLWWPYSINLKRLNDRTPGHLYTLMITLTDVATQEKDFYSLKVGIRSVRVSEEGFYVNDRRFYFRGLDANEFQREGENLHTHLSKMNWYNFNRWMLANSLRPSKNRPLTEEMMDLADKMGLVVVNEVPAIQLLNFGSSLLDSHKRQLQGLIQRDKNRPSVVMWNTASLATAKDPNADGYFRELTEFTKKLDPQGRPLTCVIRAVDLFKDVTIKYMDVVTLSWQNYEDGDEVDDSFRYRKADQDVLLQDIRNFRKLYKKPVLVGEYGIHTVQRGTCSNSKEELSVFDAFHAHFDMLRSEKILIGEMNWNCDQNTKSYRSSQENDGYYREAVRWRYINLAFKMDNFTQKDPAAFMDSETDL